MTFEALANPHTGEYGVLRRPAGDDQATTGHTHRTDPAMTTHPHPWQQLRLPAEAQRRRTTAQRKLHQQITRTRR